MNRKTEHKCTAIMGYVYKYLATGEDTGGAYTLFEILIPPNDVGPPPHIHRNEDEAFYIIEGNYTFSLDDKEFPAKPGDFIFLPRGIKHWSKNDSDSTGRVLTLLTPSGLEKLFDAIGTPVEDFTKPPPPPTNEDLIKIVTEAPKFGIELFL